MTTTTIIAGTQFNDRIVVPGTELGEPGFFQGGTFNPLADNAATDGPDSIHGDTGGDTIHAGGGNDSVFGDNGEDIVLGEDGDDLLSGDNGPDDLSGGNGNDTLRGENGAETMLGGNGSDLLASGNGAGRADFIFDLSAYDVYRTAEGSLVVAGNADHLAEGADTLEGVDTLRFAGVDHDADEFQDPPPVPPEDPDAIIGTEGGDFLSGTPEDDNIEGRGGNDTAIGLDGNDTILGQDGDDFLVADLGAGIGANSLSGGAGNDTAIGGQGSDTIEGSAGSDLLVGLDETDVLLGGDGLDVLFGGGGADQLHGENGDDVLAGEAGGDIMDGGDGNDRVHIDPDDVLATGGTGALDMLVVQGNPEEEMSFDFSALGNQNTSGFGPVVQDFEGIDGFASQAAINVTGAAEDGNGNVIFGSTFDDTLTGGDAADIIVGAAGADVIAGAGGDDTIGLDSGDDTATGGLGADTFGYIGGSTAGAVSVTDFSVTDDTVRLAESLGFTADTALAATTQVGTDAVFTAAAGRTITLVGVDIDDLTASDFAILPGI